MSWLFLTLALLMLASAVVVRRRTGLPWQHVTYADTRGWYRADQPLISHRYGLVGKPDYLLGSGKRQVPVEVKPSRRATQPYPSDMMQLAAYCLLVEETTGFRPSYGLLRYAEATFKIRFDDRLRGEIISLLNEMHTADEDRSSHRSHKEAGRCAGCGFVRDCDEALV